MKRHFIQALVGLVAAALTFDLFYLESFGAGAVLVCLIPGMLVAIVITGNVHAWPTWIAALGNFFFYFLLAQLVIAMWVKLRTKFK